MNTLSYAKAAQTHPAALFVSKAAWLELAIFVAEPFGLAWR